MSLYDDLLKIYVEWGENPPYDRPLLPFFAAELEALGYVKVTRCGECQYDSCSCDVKVFAPGLTYCSAGAPVVAKPATGEEEKE